VTSIGTLVKANVTGMRRSEDKFNLRGGGFVPSIEDALDRGAIAITTFRLSWCAPCLGSCIHDKVEEILTRYLGLAQGGVRN